MGCKLGIKHYSKRPSAPSIAQPKAGISWVKDFESACRNFKVQESGFGSLGAGSRDSSFKV